MYSFNHFIQLNAKTTIKTVGCRELPRVTETEDNKKNGSRI